MRPVLVATLLFGAVGAASAGEAPAAPPPVTLVWTDVSGVGDFAREPAQAEAGRVLAAHGVSVRWRRADRDGLYTAGEVAVVLLERDPARRPRRVMGRTGPPGSRAAWAHADEIARTLGLRASMGAWSAADRRRFARGLGRVIAHEVVHVLLPGRPHDRVGLMAPRLARNHLEADGVQVHGRLLAALRLSGR